MKILNKIRSLIFFGTILLFVSGCDVIVTDFDNDAAISGKVVDQSGNIVAGDITSSNLFVEALGEGDVITTQIRVSGEGTYQNTKLFPKNYMVWITGPLTMVSDTLTVDFNSDRIITYDFVVIPYLTVTKPVVVGNPTVNEITVSYEIIGNSEKVANRRELYCSTIPFPNASTGSGAFYITDRIALQTDSGTATVNGLESKTKYYLRVGARAAGQSGFNYSEQITVTTP